MERRKQAHDDEKLPQTLHSQMFRAMRLSSQIFTQIKGGGGGSGRSAAPVYVNGLGWE